MKVIFLDIDGVLNNQIMYEFNQETISTPGGNLSKECVELLNDITNKTRAKIIISSTWRIDPDVIEYLNAAGITGEIVGITPVLKDRFSLRGNEIHAWIVENEKLLGKEYYKFRSFIILDDDSDMLYWHKDNFFHCDGYAGLTPDTAYRAINFLNSFD